ncbi:MAG: hypothetical protein A4E66_01884 [Syntrophus sp. PtaB.Bin001]|nr:MAG: hypothetical protein A4E66_01884 [Syntrophus sp. PtaB.Bin001]
MQKNMLDQVSCCCSSDTLKASTQLTLLDGSRVGIVNLDNTFEEVSALNLADSEKIKAELLDRVAKKNYAPSCAEREYSSALFREFKRYLDQVQPE